MTVPRKMAKKLVEGFEQELTCAVCLDRFTEPKVLPCLHTYCKGCINTLVAKSREKNAVVCPKCRERYALPIGGASGFLSNFTLNNLVELLKVHESAGPGKMDAAKVLRCENGVDENVAVARCLVCCAYLCESCWKLHMKGIGTRNHETVSLEAIKEGGEKKLHKPQYCREHENEVLKLYCKTCSKAICGDCTYIDHRDHKYAFIKDVRQELRQELEGTMEGLRKKEEEFQGYLESLHRAQTEQGANVQACRREINRAFDLFVQQILLCRDLVLEELEKTAKADKKNLNSKAHDTEISLAKVSSNLSFVDRLLKSGSDTEVASMATPTLDRVKMVQGMQCERKPKMASGTLSVQAFKEVGRDIDKLFGEHVGEMEKDLKIVAQGQSPVYDNIVVEGVGKLSCGPNNFVIRVARRNRKRLKPPLQLQVKVTHKAEGTKVAENVPVTVKQTTNSSWAVSLLIRKPGESTISVLVNGVKAPGSPFVRNVEINVLAIGTRVQRGPDWEWGDQDGGGLGTVIERKSTVFSVVVKWDIGRIVGYRWGDQGIVGGEYRYDLQPVQK